MAERLKAAVLKTVNGETRSGVRIPLPPPSDSRLTLAALSADQPRRCRRRRPSREASAGSLRRCWPPPLSWASWDRALTRLRIISGAG